jgi:hypothetical protein
MECVELVGYMAGRISGAELGTGGHWTLRLLLLGRSLRVHRSARVVTTCAYTTPHKTTPHKQDKKSIYSTILISGPPPVLI